MAALGTGAPFVTAFTVVINASGVENPQLAAVVTDAGAAFLDISAESGPGLAGLGAAVRESGLRADARAASFAGDDGWHAEIGVLHVTFRR